MKRFMVLILGLVAGSVALAQGMHGMDMKDMQSHKAIGTVTKVDPAKERVTISHGAVETLKWPAMTMTFAVGDKALLENLQPGRKVEFQFVQHGKDYVITGVK